MDTTALKQIRHIALGILRHMPRTRQVVRSAYWKYRTGQYKKMAGNQQTIDNSIFFESFSGRSYSCSPRAIYETILEDERFTGFTFYWSISSARVEDVSSFEELDRAQVVIKGSGEYFDALAKSKYWITNTRIPEYVAPKDDQIYVQCWHGTPLKRLGYDVTIETQAALNTSLELANRFGIDSKKWTYLLSPSAYTSLHLADAFGLEKHRRESVVLEEGYPRNDRIARVCGDPDMLHVAVSSFREEYGIPADKKLLLYAPTWRDDSYQAGTGYVMEDTLLDFSTMQEALSDEWAVLFRAHYYIANEFDFSAHEGFVYDVSKIVDINELYIVADALLTDYSSVFFDYANTGRPMLFFWPDWEHYAGDIRGFYFDLKELPGPHCYTTAEVVDAVSSLNDYEALYGADYAKFREEFCSKDDGHAAERVVDAIFANSQ